MARQPFLFPLSFLLILTLLLGLLWSPLSQNPGPVLAAGPGTGPHVTAEQAIALTLDNFRISSMGPDGDINFEAFSPVVTYNSTHNEYLVVWSGENNIDFEAEIFGQRVNGATGLEVGTNDFRLSQMGEDHQASFDALEPAVAHNSVNNEYLVVWYGADNKQSQVDKYEIFGQRLTTGGAEVGANDFRISDMGPEGDADFVTVHPTITYNTSANEYLVAWIGSDTTVGEFRIFGQRVGADGTEIGANDFRLSETGPSSSVPSTWLNYSPVVYNPTNDEYLVVWNGTDDTPPMVEGEEEIFGQRYQLDLEIEVQGNGVIISDGDNSPSLTDHTDFGSVALDHSLTRTFTIINQGNGPLHLDGSFPVSFSGPDATSFSLESSPVTPISGRGSATFTLGFSPTLSGSRMATVTLASNDNDENLYSFAIRGTGARPPVYLPVVTK